MIHKEFAERRERLAQHMDNNSIAIFKGAELKTRNRDIEYPFRQDSDFYYLFGYEEPNAMAVLVKDTDGNLTYLLFNQKKDQQEEIWTGIRIGQEKAIEEYGADQAHCIDNIEDLILPLLQDKSSLYFKFGDDPDFTKQVLTWRNKLWKTGVTVPDAYKNIRGHLHQMRLIKSEWEIKQIQEAIDITTRAHCEIMREIHPDINEREIASQFEMICSAGGCKELAYPTIVAGGKNGCTLHYIKNDKPIQDNMMLLIDGGCTNRDGFYTADVTRTYPVDGRFDGDQQLLYQLVLDAQKAGIEAIKPGVSWEEVETVISTVIIQGLLNLGIMQGDCQEILADKTYKAFYPHQFGHWLGLDVHDVDGYKRDVESTLQENMVLTVEPGIYIQPNCETVDKCWRGMAVRIEDDVLVTANGCKVLTSKIPKEVAELEKVVGSYHQAEHEESFDENMLPLFIDNTTTNRQVDLLLCDDEEVDLKIHPSNSLTG